MRWCDDWLLLPQRLALHVPTATAVIADVHLGYGAVRCRLGDAIPIATVAEEMQPLVEAARLHEIRGLVVAGDLFEAGYDAILFRDFRAVLEQLNVTFTGLVPGNHDGAIDKAAEVIPVLTDSHRLADWSVQHGDRPPSANRSIAGHWHPAVCRGRRKVPCFLACGTKLILPAFSHDAAGASIDRELRWRSWDYLAIDGDGVQAPCRVGKKTKNA